MQKGVAQMEALFASSKGDVKALKNLQTELSHRKVPRAAVLAKKVEMALKNLSISPSTPAFAPAGPKGALPITPDSLPMTSIQQPDFWKTSPDLKLVEDQPLPEPSIESTAQKTAPPPAPKLPGNTPALSLDAAYKMLLASASSTWESIEFTRRRLVQQAHPHALEKLDADGKNEAQSVARLANAAYIIIRLSRET